MIVRPAQHKLARQINYILVSVVPEGTVIRETLFYWSVGMLFACSLSYPNFK